MQYEFVHKMTLEDQMTGMFNRIADGINLIVPTEHHLSYKDGVIRLDTEQPLSENQVSEIQNTIKGQTS